MKSSMADLEAEVGEITKSYHAQKAMTEELISSYTATVRDSETRLRELHAARDQALARRDEVFKSASTSEQERAKLVEELDHLKSQISAKLTEAQGKQRAAVEQYDQYIASTPDFYPEMRFKGERAEDHQQGGFRGGA